MGRANAVFIAPVGLVLVFVGALQVKEEPAAGVGSIAFGTTLVTFAIANVLKRRPSEHPAVELTVCRWGNEALEGFGLTTSRTQMRLILIMATGFVAAGSALFAAPDIFGHGVFNGLPRATGVAAVLLFGLGVIIALRMGGRTTLVLLRPGIAIGGPFKVLIEWSNVERVAETVYMGQTFVSIEARDRARIRTDLVGRLMLKANRRLTGSDLGIGTRTLLIPPDRLKRILRRYVDDPLARERIGSLAELAAVQVA